jgi:hypothetical protein
MTVNRLSVASPATLLFSHAGQGHQLKLNKAEASDTGTLLFQTGWSGAPKWALPLAMIGSRSRSAPMAATG